MGLSCSKKLSALLRRITSKHYDNFYCLVCLHFFATEKNLNHIKICENKDFCNVIMPSEVIKILEFDQYQKPDKSPFIIRSAKLGNLTHFFTRDFQIHNKAYPQILKIFTHTHKHRHDPF